MIMLKKSGEHCNLVAKIIGYQNDDLVVLHVGLRHSFFDKCHNLPRIVTTHNRSYKLWCHRPVTQTRPNSGPTVQIIHHVHLVFTHAMLASAGISCRHVCLSVTSQCSIEMAKCKTVPTMPHNGLGLVVFWCRKSRQNSNWVTTPIRGTKCRWGRLNAAAVMENWRLSTWSAVNSAQLQVYHIELLVCRTIAICSVSRRLVSDSWSLLFLLCPSGSIVMNVSLCLPAL